MSDNVFPLFAKKQPADTSNSPFTDLYKPDSAQRVDLFTHPLRMLKRFTFLFALFLFSKANAQNQFCNNEVFRAGYTFWDQKGYVNFTLERSIGRHSLQMSIGGGALGSNEEYISREELSEIRKRMKVNDSKTIPIPRIEFTEPVYLERTKTKYSGVLLRFGYSYYLQPSFCGEKLSGLYIGADLSGIRTFEFQTLTYRGLNTNKATEISGENRFYTIGMGLKAGYQWIPFAASGLCLNAEVAHPFYIPFTEEINTQGPFTAGQWEISLGIGWRIKVK